MASGAPDEIPQNLGTGKLYFDAMNGTDFQVDAETWQQFLDSLDEGITLSNSSGQNASQSVMSGTEDPAMDVDSQHDEIPRYFNPDVSPPAALAPVNNNIPQLPVTPHGYIASTAQHPNSPRNQNVMFTQQLQSAQQTQTLASTNHNIVYSQPSPATQPAVLASQPSPAPQQPVVVAPQLQVVPNGLNQHMALPGYTETTQHPGHAWIPTTTVSQPVLSAQPQVPNGIPQLQNVTSQPEQAWMFPPSPAMNNTGALYQPSEAPNMVRLHQQPMTPPVGTYTQQQQSERAWTPGTQPVPYPYAHTPPSQTVPYNPHTHVNHAVPLDTYTPANQQNAQASPPLQQNPDEVIEKGQEMQLRVWYKHLRIRCEGIQAHGESRHDINNPAGFVLYYDKVHPEIPESAIKFQLPLNTSTCNLFNKEDSDSIIDACKDMKGGLHVYYDPDLGVIYATRYSRTGVYFWSNDKSPKSTDTSKLERKTPTPVFDFKAYFSRLDQMDKEMISKEANPVVVFTLGWPWTLGSGSLLEQKIHIEITPMAAIQKLDKVNTGNVKSKSIPKGKTNAYKSKETYSMDP